MTALFAARGTALLLAALPLLALPAVGQKVKDGLVTWPDGLTMEVGQPGQLPPTARAGEPLLVHDDRHGGAAQLLLEVAAGKGGFSAAWTDLRDGNQGLFVGHVSADGATLLDGAPVHLPRSSRQKAPRLALIPGAPDGPRRGLVAWVAMEMDGERIMLRELGEGGEAELERGGAGALVELPRPLAKVDRSDGPRLVLGPDGPGLVAWLDGDRLVGRALLIDRETGRPVPGPALVIAEDFAPVAAQYELALGLRGQGLLVWAEQGPAQDDGAPPLVTRAMALNLTTGVAARVTPLGDGDPEPGEEEPQIIELGEGRPLELATGPAGYWLALGRQAGIELLRLTPDGALTEASVVVAAGAVSSADLCTWSDGRATALLVETAVPREGAEPRASTAGRLDLHVFDDQLNRLTPEGGLPALDAGAVEARRARLAALGTRFLVAWTDDREGQADVWFRLLGLAELDAPARRWNRDEASGSQAHAAVASDRGRRAAVAWEDDRDGTARIWSRSLTLGEDGALAPGAEGPVDPEGGERMAMPTVAMAEGGDRLVVWKELVGGTWTLRGRALAEDGAPLGPAVDLDPGHAVGHAWPAAAVSLGRGAGYAVAWIRPTEGPVLRRVSAVARPLGRALLLVPRALGAAAEPRNVDIERLDGGRLVVAWDQLAAQRVPAGKPNKPGAGAPPPSPQTRQVLARLVDARLTPSLKPVSLGRSPQGGDHDPALAATPGGGFLVAWTGNDGPVRDVFAQAFAADGRPADPPMAISVKANEQDFADAIRLEDGRVLVAWEDDISGRDHCFARAVDTRRPSARPSPANQRPPRGELQPRVLLNELETVYVEDRHAPRVAPMAGGYVVVYDDLGRGRGHDVMARWVALP